MIDPTAEQFCFRTFDDGKAKRAALTSKCEGPFEAVVKDLLQRNDKGAGAFVVVNEGGHTKDQINRVRAVFADTDGAPLEPIVEALTPSYVINTSPGKWHVYWRMKPDFPLEKFALVQKAIADKFGTDPSVIDLSRVMRVPGFKHNKASPFQVKIVEFDQAMTSYSYDELLTKLGLTLHSPPRAPEMQRSLAITNAMVGPTPTSLTDIEEMLRYVDPWSRRKEWMRVCFALADEHGEAARDLFVRWSRGDLWIGGDNATA